jgi:hypothetical protein
MCARLPRLSPAGPAPLHPPADASTNLTTRALLCAAGGMACNSEADLTSWATVPVHLDELTFLDTGSGGATVQ